MVQQPTCGKEVTAAGAYKGTGRRPSARTSCALQASPRSRGSLASGYEARFGHASAIVTQDASAPSAASARPSRKPGVTTFSDPTNPFARALSKHITRIEDARNENDRAGARTRNPGMIPSDVGSCVDRSMSEDGRHPLVAHRYTTSADWRPGKRCPDHNAPGGGSGPTNPRSPRCSEGMATVLPDGGSQKVRPSALGNYLNDMKRCQKSLRPVPATPSNFLQRMNDERVKLPSDRRIDKMRDTNSSCSLLSPRGSELEQIDRPQSARMHRSFSCDPRIQRSAVQGEINVREDSYGFTRKREVSGDWARNRGMELLHHSPGHNDPPPCSTPRRTDRLAQKADERFVEMVAHMKAANPEQKLHFEHFKARSETTGSLLSHDMTPRPSP